MGINWNRLHELKKENCTDFINIFAIDTSRTTLLYSINWKCIAIEELSTKFSHILGLFGTRLLRFREQICEIFAVQPAAPSNGFFVSSISPFLRNDSFFSF